MKLKIIRSDDLYTPVLIEFDKTHTVMLRFHPKKKLLVSFFNDKGNQGIEVTYDEFMKLLNIEIEGDEKQCQI